MSPGCTLALLALAEAWKALGWSNVTVSKAHVCLLQAASHLNVAVGFKSAISSNSYVAFVDLHNATLVKSVLFNIDRPSYTVMLVVQQETDLLMLKKLISKAKVSKGFYVLSSINDENATTLTEMAVLSKWKTSFLQHQMTLNRNGQFVVPKYDLQG